MNTDDATVVPAAGGWTLIFVRDLRHDPARVWSALTDPALLDQWAPFAAERDLSTTGDTTLTMVDGDERTPIAATVQRAEEPALLEYTWGEDLLRWELTPQDGGTRLTLRHTVAKREIGPDIAAGWNLCAGRLTLLLDGRPAGVVRGREALAHGWSDLRDAYAKKFAN